MPGEPVAVAVGVGEGPTATRAQAEIIAAVHIAAYTSPMRNSRGMAVPYWVSVMGTEMDAVEPSLRCAFKSS